MTTPRASLKNDLSNAFRGFFMGGADVVPGVSGGTVALILGIYERLVTAISHFDWQLIEHVRRGRWKQAAHHIDLRFLTALACGIGCGFLMMTVLMNRLLTQHTTRSLTLAAFFGLILGSSLIVAMLVRVKSGRQTASCFALGVCGAAFAFWLTTLSNSSADPTYPYIFFCGCVAICAMILPGISGAMILLILGVYIHLTEVPRNLLKGEHVIESLLTTVVFVTGAGISLILFSKFLRWLLRHFHASTMSILCGFMIGALPKLWPFQRDLTPDIEKFKYKQFELYFPASTDGLTLSVIAVMILAAVGVLGVDWLSRGRHLPTRSTAPVKE